MGSGILANTTVRILRQLRHDRRSIALLVGAPTLLLALLYFMLERQPAAFQRVGIVTLGVFPFIVMFLLTSIAMLRERTTGTLERLFTTPMTKPDLVFGYGIAFGLAATVQAMVITALGYWLFGLESSGSSWLVVLVAVANAILGVALGLLCSAFARSEFQAVQFLPLVAFPQLLLCGLFVPRDQMASWLETVSNLMPLTYSVDALVRVGTQVAPTRDLWIDLAIVAGVIVVALVLGSGTLRRRTP